MGNFFHGCRTRTSIIDKSKNKISNFDEIEAYREKIKNKTEFERTQVNKR